jgi:hypothetical protein
MTSTQTLKNRANKELSAVNTCYHIAIPLDLIFLIVSRHIGAVVQEDGSPWSGILCGDEGRAVFAIADSKISLYLSWYKMSSGRYEIVSYVS